MPTISWIKIIPYAIVVVLVLGGIFYIYNKGQTDERNSIAGKTLEQVQKDTKQRENIDQNEHSRSIDDAIKCLRNPNGC